MVPRLDQEPAGGGPQHLQGRYHFQHGAFLLHSPGFPPGQQAREPGPPAGLVLHGSPPGQRLCGNRVVPQLEAQVEATSAQEGLKRGPQNFGKQLEEAGELHC